MTSYIERRDLPSGKVRYVVRYRLAGRMGGLLYGGSFHTEELAQLRLDSIRGLIKSGEMPAGGLREYQDMVFGRNGRRKPAPEPPPRVPLLSEREGYVYFIESAGLVKIGWSEEPEARLATLRIASATPTALIAAIPGSPLLEREIHDEYAEYRCHGEWFALPAETVESLRS